MGRSFLGSTRQAEWPRHKGEEGSTPQEAKFLLNLRRTLKQWMEPTPSGSLAVCSPRASLGNKCTCQQLLIDAAPPSHHFLPNHERNWQPRQHLLSLQCFLQQHILLIFTQFYIISPPNISCLVISSRHIEHGDFFYEEIFRYQKLKPSSGTDHALTPFTLKMIYLFKSHCSLWFRAWTERRLRGGMLCREAWGLW